MKTTNGGRWRETPDLTPRIRITSKIIIQRVPPHLCVQFVQFCDFARDSHDLVFTKRSFLFRNVHFCSLLFIFDCGNQAFDTNAESLRGAQTRVRAGEV
jgi:hypothetical protein